jgi:hypothetical protein
MIKDAIKRIQKWRLPGRDRNHQKEPGGNPGIEK